MTFIFDICLPHKCQYQEHFTVFIHKTFCLCCVRFVFIFADNAVKLAIK